MTRRPVSLLAALVMSAAVVLGTQPVAGQDAPWYALVHSGCVGDPSRFHPCALTKAGSFTPVRTPDGAPDLRGYWFGGPGNSQNIEAHPDMFAIPGGPSLIVEPADGKIPYQPWAAAERARHFKAYLDPIGQCFPSGVPRQMYIPYGFQLVQVPGYVVLVFEQNHSFRAIPTDGRPHADRDVRLWQMDSRGRWEGETLAVDVTNANGRHWLDAQGNFFSAAVHIVERFTMIDADTIHYQATIDDARVYTRPWTMAFALRRHKEPDYELLESACREGERDELSTRSLGYTTFPGVMLPR